MQKIVEVVRAVVGKDAVLFNDKLKDGTRSVKVNYGHDEAQVDAVKAALEAAGYKAEKVKTMARLAGSMTRYEALRLHVA